MSTTPMIRHAENAIDKEIGMLLRAGVALSAALIAFGGLIYLVHNGHTFPSYHRFTGVPSELNSIHQVIHGTLRGNALAIIQCGILVLVAMPIVRVVLSAIAFALESDWLYVIISGLVLSVLIYSLIGHVA